MFAPIGENDMNLGESAGDHQTRQSASGAEVEQGATILRHCDHEGVGVSNGGRERGLTERTALTQEFEY